jgi:hypothetical protein
VEKLYGQHPILKFENVRCKTCDLCTAKGCFDLGPERSALIAAADRNKSRRWLISGFGIFALAFPGLILGYFQVADVRLSEALQVYLVCLGFSLASYILFAGIFAVLRTRMRTALPILAAIAASLYYWFSPVSMAETLGFGLVFVNFVRFGMGVAILYWLYTVVQSNRRFTQRADEHRTFHPAPAHLESSSV